MAHRYYTGNSIANCCVGGLVPEVCSECNGSVRLFPKCKPCNYSGFRYRPCPKGCPRTASSSGGAGSGPSSDAAYGGGTGYGSGGSWQGSGGQGYGNAGRR